MEMAGGGRRSVVQFDAYLANVADPRALRVRHLWPPLYRAVGQRQFEMANIRIHNSKKPEQLEKDAVRLRYYMHDRASSFRFKLAGALAGEDVTELEQCWSAASSTVADRAFVVDLSELSAVDEPGRELLSRWHKHGAEFIATSVWSRSLVESITGYPPVASPNKASARACLPFRIAPVLFISLVTLMLPGTVSAGSSGETEFVIVAQPAPSPSSLLNRYLAGLPQTAATLECRAVAVEVQAALPKLSKRGRLQAIQHYVPLGRPEFQVLHVEGDRTVTQQVIARYLSAKSQAEAMPSSLVAVSAANYKFRYVGFIGTDRTLAYVFHITPRKRRVGLIEGELWIDVSSGVAVHEAGRLVKNPSAFLRRVDVIQDTDLREGRPYLRITRLDIETRLVGRAELRVKERPCDLQTAKIENNLGKGSDDNVCSVNP